MRKRLILCAFALATVCAAAEPGKTRPSAVAGSFYPAGAKELAEMVDGFLAKAASAPVPGLIALVAPHAGYPYSGPVAAHAYALLKGETFARVVVISPSHLDGFGFSAVYDGAAYATPLGLVKVDHEFASRLAASGAAKLSSRGHAVSGDRGEHALEVQLPFLQRTLKDFRLVPVVMGDQSYESCRALGVALAKLIRGDTLIVASSDLSHYHPNDAAVKLDRRTLKAVEEWDYFSMARNFESQVWEACGGGPMVAAMIAAERLGARQAKVLNYANSGDTSGDRSRVVGYGAVAIARGAAERSGLERPFTLTPAEKNELLRIARQSVQTAVRDHKLYDYPGSSLPSLMQERGAFVTLKEHGELRGCIGYSSPLKPLCLAVRDVAAMAAVEDSRFRPIAAAELPQLEYEISVMSPLRHVGDIGEIRVGTHGLVIKKGRHEGLLLPQVPVEQGWDCATFLDQTCLKAGLPDGAWKDPDADLFLFTSLVFGESTPRRFRLPSVPPSSRSRTRE